MDYDYHEKIRRLAELFAEYRTYPYERYQHNSPAIVFQEMYPENHYSKDLNIFFEYQDYSTDQIGADLPWWGEKYFTNEPGFRTLIVSQDSLANDVGSIVFFAHLLPIVQNSAEYAQYNDRLDHNHCYRYRSWKMVKEYLLKWKLDFDYLYITDARKVYKPDSLQYKNIDRQKRRKYFHESKCKKLLEAEIDFCNPDLIILLGAPSLRLLDKNRKYAAIVDNNEPILINQRKAIVAPFPSSLSKTQPRFSERMANATKLILEQGVQNETSTR
ncbi:MAG: uracil-DNA glycosylase family protein [Thermoactinomyces sp.]